MKQTIIKGNTDMTYITKTLLTLCVLNHVNAEAIELRIDDVKLYQTASQTFSTPSTVYIGEGKILRIDSSEQKKEDAETVVNAKGQYALPGLTDLHVHLGSSGSNFTEFQYLPVKAHFNSNLYLGVTNIVDLFSFKQTLDEAALLKQQQLTPNLFYAGTLFTNPGGHGTQFGGQAYEIAKDEDIDALWQQHLATSPSVTKAVIETFGGMGGSLSDSQLAELGKRSKAANLPYFVHVSTLDDGKRALKAGATALAHGINTENVDQEFIDLMLANNVTYIPTLAVYYNHHEEKHHNLISEQSELLSTTHSKLQHCLFEEVPNPSKWRDQSWNTRSIAYKNLQKLSKAGVNIGAGSDAGNPYTLHGTGLHNELAALSKAGLSNGQVINAATSNAAIALNQQASFGQLKKGYEASFILVQKNPLDDIKNIHDINVVYKSGERINRDELVAQNILIEPIGQACHQTMIASHATIVIDDFSGESPWQALSDKVMGGQSLAALEAQDNQLTISTEIGKATTFGAWAGSEIKYESPQDASKYKGVTITYKGSSVPFALSLYHSDVKDWDHFTTILMPSNEWKTVSLPFESFRQFGFGNKVDWSAQQLVGLNLMWRKMPGASDAPLKNALEVKALSYF